MASPVPEETKKERTALEQAWEQRGVPPDIPDSPWRVGAALHDEFEAGWVAALRRRDRDMPRFGGGSLLWDGVSDAEVEAAMAVVLREVIKPNPQTSWTDTIREALDAAARERR